MNAPSHDYPHLAVTTDVVIFSVRAASLQVLLVRRARAPFAGTWALPGGFVQHDEALDIAAARKLHEETGLRGVYLEQLYTFGQPDRDPRDRVITVAYYALTPSDKLALTPANEAHEVAWHAFDRLPKLAFDHAEIVQRAHQRLVAKLDYSTIVFQFMPEKFTLGELQKVFEIIRHEPIDKRNFRKWIMSLDLVEETGEERREGKHRPAQLYRATARNKVRIIR